MKTPIFLLLMTSCAISPAYGLDGEATTAATTYQLSEENQRLANTYERMFRYYAKRNFSSTRTIRVLLSNYPEHVTPILYAAFERYPNHYEHIIRAAIHSEPAFTNQIIDAAMLANVAPADELVRIAVEAEPSYADAIVIEASKRNPESVESLVRVAVTTEPQMADSIMQSASREQPEQTAGIVQATLEALPNFGNYLSTQLSDLISHLSANDGDQVASREHAKSVLRGAHQAGMSYEDLKLLAANYGISEKELEATLKD